MRRQNHPVRPGLKQLALGGRVLAAGDDREIRVQLASAERDENIARIRRQDRGKHCRAGHAGFQQDRLFCRLALQCQVAGLTGGF